MARYFLLMNLIVLGVIGCSSEAPTPRVVTATPGAIDALTTAEQEELPPLTVRGQTDGATATPVLAATSMPQACSLESVENTRTQYTVDAALNWAAQQVTVEEEIRYFNLTGRALQSLVFQVEPHREPGFFSLHGISTSEGRPLEDIALVLNRMEVGLPDALAPGCDITLTMSYTLRIPPVLEGYFGRFGYLGFTDKQVNLGHWLPTVAVYREDWYAPRPHVVGEQSISEVADYEVTLQVDNAPPTIDVAGPGQMRVLGDNQWAFTTENARDFAVSVGNGFRRTSQLAPGGTVVEVYYFPETSAGSGFNAAAQSLKSATEALTLYEELFGVSYPYERLVIVEGDFADGMEFSGIAFVGEAWFRTWRGEAHDWITIITVHEVAHQWWYAMIGSDSAADPYLDEAFATYSEYLYIQRYIPDQAEWWWNFRVRGYDTVPGVLDANVYQYDNARPYINATYLKGAEMLSVMRALLGDEAFFAWLMRYVEDNQFGIATPEDLWGALSDEQYTQAQPVRERYMGQPSVFGPPATAIPIPTPGD